MMDVIMECISDKILFQANCSMKTRDPQTIPPKTAADAGNKNDSKEPHELSLKINIFGVNRSVKNCKRCIFNIYFNQHIKIQ